MTGLVKRGNEDYRSGQARGLSVDRYVVPGLLTDLIQAAKTLSV